MPDSAWLGVSAGADGRITDGFEIGKALSSSHVCGAVAGFTSGIGAARSGGKVGSSYSVAGALRRPGVKNSCVLAASAGRCGTAEGAAASTTGAAAKAAGNTASIGLSNAGI